MVNNYEEVKITRLENVLARIRGREGVKTVLTQDVYNIGEETVLAARNTSLSSRLRERLEDDVELGVLCYRIVKRL